jgi:hypothetical protein
LSIISTYWTVAWSASDNQLDGWHSGRQGRPNNETARRAPGGSHLKQRREGTRTVKSNQNREKKPWPADALYAPLGPATRILRRGADVQLRAQFLPTVGDAGALDLRLFRRSPNVTDLDGAYLPTGAGFCVPREQLRELIGILNEIAGELER